jgi:hypothetical protein
MASGIRSAAAALAVLLLTLPAGADSRKAPNHVAPAGGGAVLAPGLYRIEGLDQYGTGFSGMVTATTSRAGFDLTAWIGGEKYQGDAYVSRGPVEMHWNDEAVSYRPDADGSLKGGWIGGGTSTLTLYAAADPAAPAPAGRYEVEGQNPGGQGIYRGIFVLERAGDGYSATWQIQGSTIPGTGTLADGVLVLDYGSPSPAVYALQPDGSLSGLWSSGAGSEVLTPIPE